MVEPLKPPRVPINSSNLDWSSLIQSQIWNTAHTIKHPFLWGIHARIHTHTHAACMCVWRVSHQWILFIFSWSSHLSEMLATVVRQCARPCPFICIMVTSLMVGEPKSPYSAFYSQCVPCMSSFDPERAASVAHLCLDPLAALLAPRIEIQVSDYRSDIG